MFASKLLAATFLDPPDTVPDLNSWDFLTDLDTGHETLTASDQSGHVSVAPHNMQSLSGMNTDAHAPSSQCTQGLTALERKQEKNRLAQKRFRQRKKERSSTTEVQLAETASELQMLKIRQRELEARNALLEQLANLNKQQKLQQGLQPGLCDLGGNEGCWQAQARTSLANVAETAMDGSAIVLTVYGYKQLVTMEEFAGMPITEFAKLYTAYARKQAQCLLEIADKPESPVMASLQRWSLEVASLFMALYINNPKGMDTIQASRMDSGLPSEPHPDQFHDSLLDAYDFTPSQTRDLLSLRRLFYGRVGQLVRERQALLAKMPVAGEITQRMKSQPVKVSFHEASDALGEMTETAAKLRTNALAESNAYKSFTGAFFTGIQTSKQRAISMVHPYPFVPDTTQVLEALARQCKEPSIRILMEPGEFDDLQHVANWEDVVKYHQDTSGPSKLHDHHPFLKDDAHLE